jgi:toxin ParE1/3/4
VKLVWSPLAIARAAEAAAFIAGDKREAAHRWLEGLFRSVDRLQRFPRSGRVLPEIGSPEYREIPYRSHRVIYKVQKSTISILTIRHSRQRFDSADMPIEE